MNIISLIKRVVDTDIVNDITYMRQSVITHVVIRFFTAWRYPLNNSDVIWWKYILLLLPDQDPAGLVFFLLKMVYLLCLEKNNRKSVIVCPIFFWLQ